MQNWLMSADEKSFCHQYYFDKDGFIDWGQHYKFEVNDIVYIYSKLPIGRIKWKTIVEKVDMPISESAYPKEFENSNCEYLVRFKLLEQVNMEELSYENLKENGLKIAPRGAMKLDGNLLDYIEGIFKEKPIKDMWMIRAGKDSFLIDEFIYGNLIAFRFGKIGDLTGMSEEDIKQIFKEKYPDCISGMDLYCAELEKFRDNLKVGDYVISYDKPNRRYWLGEITSDYYFGQDLDAEEKDKQGGFPHTRNINWLGEISRDKLKDDTKKTLRTPPALFSIKEESKKDILNVFENRENKPNMWMINAGYGGSVIDDFKDRSVVALGWGIGDVAGKTQKDIKNLLIENDVKDTDVGKAAAAIYKFKSILKKGDYVVSAYPKEYKKYLLGKIVSDYYYSEKFIQDNEKPDCNYHKFRDVEWMCLIHSDKLSEVGIPQPRPGTLTGVVDELKDKILKFLDNPFESNLQRNKIYFGAPGTGKSYTLNKDKDDLLLNPLYDYERVTFHPDYSYANFVGTYKPRPKKDEEGNKTDDITYEYVPGPFMRSLVKALKNPSKPFLLIIEEINRSNVAAVFGDVFQLLDRDENNESEYPIETSEDMRDYLKEELEQDFEKIKIPSNMFIWATMNTADQGVFPMDTAFKRRWNFKYLGIDDAEDEIKDTQIEFNKKTLLWDDLRKIINKELIFYGVNEDKLLGPFFAFNEYIGKEINEEDFKEIFKNKIIMYLFEDAVRSRRNELFERVKDTEYDNIIYSRLCKEFDDNGFAIFSEEIEKEINSKMSEYESSNSDESETISD